MDSVQRQKDHFETISEKYYAARRGRNHLLLKKLLWSAFFRDKQDLKENVRTVLEPMCGYSEGRKILNEQLNVNFHYVRSSR